MATKRRRPAKRTTKRKRTAAIGQAPRRRPPRAGAGSFTREAPRAEVARSVEPATGPRLVAVEGGGSAGPDRAAEAPATVGAVVPGLARPAEEPGARSGPDADVQRRAAAEAELSRRRAVTEEAARSEADRSLPGLSAIGVELALGAMRLARTMLTAPLRIALAFLRAREA